MREVGRMKKLSIPTIDAIINQYQLIDGEWSLKLTSSVTNIRRELGFSTKETNIRSFVVGLV